MTPERWQQVKEVLDTALSMPATDRGGYLEKTCAGDPELRQEVDSLLAAQRATGAHLIDAPAFHLQTAAAAAPAPARKGRRVGAYLLLEEIGRGGMGEVYSAVRADGQYEKKVAVKLVRRGYDSGHMLERFRHERQILAGLDHPNVARLIDGGTTEEDLPYLVMELVEGTPISSYCDAHKLTITQRLKLFLEVCGAVHYAHQRLVIHRDIKPRNILVTQQGVPKLLDFGIAKILDPEVAAETTLLRPMTPEYASPEQVRGEAITTASDVYSLGVVLYELLTGRSPYDIENRSPARLAEAIVSKDPERPSTAIGREESTLHNGAAREVTPETISSTREATPLRLQQRLKGDLDFILLKALRKEAAQRYSSVERFSDDIQRHLNGLPVAARKGTWSYRAGKFLQRHRAGVAAATLVSASVVAGIIISVHEARVAEANRRRAEARLNDVRKLSNSLMFEVHDAIESIPGTTQARKLVVQKSLEYLERLAQESGNDPDSLRDLATAYRRIGIIQGNPKDPNLGDTEGALASFKKSLEIRETLARLSPRNSKDQVQLGVAYLDFADFQSANNIAAAYEYCKKGLAVLDREALAKPNDLQVLTQSTRGYVSLGMMEVGEGTGGRIGTLPEAVTDLKKALVFDQKIIQLSPSDLSFKGEQTLIHGLLGDAFLGLGDRAQALTYYRSAIDTLSALSAKEDNIRFVSNLSILQGKMGYALLMEDRSAEAIPYFLRAQQAALRLFALDNANEFLVRTKISSTGDLGVAYVEAGRVPEGIQKIRDALAQSQTDTAQTPDLLSMQSTFHTWMGQALRRQGKGSEAAHEYAAARKQISALRTSGSDDLQKQISFCSATDGLAGSFLKLGEIEKAKEAYDQSLAILEPLQRVKADDQEVLYALANTYTGEAEVSMKRAQHSRAHEAKHANWQAAHEWLQKSLSTWKKVSNPARISVNGIEVTPPSEVEQRLADCDRQLLLLNNSARMQ